MAVSYRISAGGLPGVVVCLIILVGVTKSFGYDDPVGFLSIDCGSDRSTQDLKTNLLWVSDENYISTGSSGSVGDVHPSLENSEALRTFRYFSNVNRRSKYCYELPMTRNNISLLLRAIFLHGNSTKLEVPFDFDIHVNATKWKTIVYKKGYNLALPYWIEGIFFIPPEARRTDICLVPREGIPFISSLEMRYLDPEGIMYSESFEHHTRQQLYFETLLRWNSGATDTAILRYPEDEYDRLWMFPDIGRGNDTLTPVTSSLQTDTRMDLKINAVPSRVMIDAWKPKNDGGVNFHVPLPNTEAGSLVYGIFYFAILDTQVNITQLPINLALDTQTYPSFNISRTPTMKSFFLVLNTNYTAIQFEGPFMLNGLEFYGQNSFIAPTTNSSDVGVINFLKETFGKTDWEGDPCTPRPYDWITCELSFFEGDAWDVTSIDLSQLQNSERLTQLGTRRMHALQKLSITHSNINTSTFSSLLRNFLTGGSLHFLNFSNNNITTLSDAKSWSRVSWDEDVDGIYLDFSYNQLSEIPSMAEFPFSPFVYSLDFSSNKIEGVFPNTSRFANLSHLHILNISNNHINGPIPESLSSSNLPALGVLDISNNEFSGEFNSGFYFLELEKGGSFSELNASNNALVGVLDLSTWYHNLESISRDSLSPTGRIDFGGLFSFVNNSIASIHPGAEQFESLLKSLIHEQHFNQSGVLLGGNPYCEDAKSFTERYFCRSHVDELVNAEEDDGGKKVAIIVASVVGGSVVFLGFLILSLIIWRLSKQVFHLKHIQHELANRSVQPPFFSYRDIRVATRKFHHSKRLGSGTYGAVYKGTLSDGTTVAVKRLFHAKQKQVLNDFLNEVVLITGIKHKNLVQLKGCCVENQERILVYECVENGNVADALWGGHTRELMLDWNDRLNICIGVARGLSYLHEELQPRIIHRDIKPANILLDRNLNPKIADFGTARTFAGGDQDDNANFTQVVAGTKGYFAPEYIMEGKLTTKADVYSFGVFVLEIMSGRRWSDSPSENIQLQKWAKTLQSKDALPELLDPALRSQRHQHEVIRAINIALMCVRIDPELRPTMSEVETMLLEGKERSYNDLSSASHNENSAPLYTIYESIGVEFGPSTSSRTRGDFNTSATSTSSTTLGDTQADNLPLLWPKLSPTSRKAYFQSFQSLTRSLSDRIRRK